MKAPITEYDGLMVKKPGINIKIVRGYVENDGDYYYRWVPAYYDDGVWRLVDRYDTVDGVDAILDNEQLNAIVNKSNA